MFSGVENCCLSPPAERAVLASRKPVSERYTLRGTGCGFDDQQIRPGGLQVAQEFCDLQEFVVARCAVLRQRITTGGLDCADFAKIATDTGLGSNKSPGYQCRDQRLLICCRSVQQQLADSFAAIELDFV
jgi:hypothetical protein